VRQPVHSAGARKQVDRHLLGQRPVFVVALRAKIGHAPLPLSGVIAVVLDEQDRVLLVRRSDSGEWALTTGTDREGNPVPLCC
jgi:hypothetical protein